MCYCGLTVTHEALGVGRLVSDLIRIPRAWSDVRTTLASTVVSPNQRPNGSGGISHHRANNVNLRLRGYLARQPKLPDVLKIGHKVYEIKAENLRGAIGDRFGWTLQKAHDELKMNFSSLG